MVWNLPQEYKVFVLEVLWVRELGLDAGLVDPGGEPGQVAGAQQARHVELQPGQQSQVGERVQLKQADN